MVNVTCPAQQIVYVYQKPTSMPITRPDADLSSEPWIIRVFHLWLLTLWANPKNAKLLSRFLFWTLTTLLVGTAGVMSGCTLALFTLDPTHLRAIANGRKEREKRQAMRVLPLLEHPHWTLVTMLLMNAAAVESLPLALTHVASQFMAVVMSVFLVLVFGEIIPQAFFVQHALAVCSFFSPLLNALMVLTAPVSWSLSKVLDKVIGHKENTFMRRAELKQLLMLHLRKQQKDTSSQHFSVAKLFSRNKPQPPAPELPLAPLASRSGSSPATAAATPNNSSLSDPTAVQLVRTVEEGDEDNPYLITDSEMRVMMGALSLSERTVADVMKVPLSKVFYVNKNQLIDKDIVQRIFNHGFSRIPVFNEEPRRFERYFLARSLVNLAYRDPEEAPRAGDIPSVEILECREDTPLGDLYQLFADYTTPIAIVMAADGSRPVGLITFEDVFEAVHGIEIYDEFDRDSKSRAQQEWRTRISQAHVLRALAPTAVPTLGLDRALTSTARSAADLSDFGDIMPLPRSTRASGSHLITPNERTRLVHNGYATDGGTFDNRRYSASGARRGRGAPFGRGSFGSQS